MPGNRKLGRRTSSRVAMINGLAAQLLWNGRITTTEERAKEVRKVAERVITLAINSYRDRIPVTKKKINLKNEEVDEKFVNDGPARLAARRRIMSILPDLQETRERKESKANYRLRTKDIFHPLIEKIFGEYAPRFDANRNLDAPAAANGGYTRICKLPNRRGDNASQCVIEVLPELTQKSSEIK